MNQPYTFKEIVLIVVCIAAFGAFLAYLWNEKATTARAERVMAGAVRGNIQTRVFHVPGCPQYDSIKQGNIREFATVSDAETANFEGSMNCLEAINYRRSAENGEFDETDLGGYEDPRQ